ncbi:ABC-F family ATP-binding cassette domain-containing protein [Nocardia stercoris]|uniref:ABC transporter ATP-binding protein n=1 Tax=Nocardia stercoris TaxID=2483361 RepID=A0A3M2LEB4_9NOCA|nr:ATP-binding cassette domain-containing protein [Nocardia stercoris]RMI35879.1 ABC transporter ATP-binding protein [Nocardia stercoris]
MCTVTLSDLTFARPDGPVLFEGLNATFGPGPVGLIGANGAGKTTLLRLIAGRLRPARGSVTVTGQLGYLRQDLTLAAGQQVSTVLGLDPVRDALHRIESGHGTEADFELADGNWDVEERAIALLGRLGLPYLADDVTHLDRRLDTLSGGETELLGLVAELLREPDALLLDEPTNNLDSVARERLWSVIAEFSGTVLVAGHDRELLDRMGTIAELRRGEIRMFGGNFAHYEEIVDAEQEAARAAVRDARSDVRKQAQELIAARTTIDRRRRYGQKMFENKREPKIVMGQRKRQAQESAGKYRNLHLDRVAEAREQLAHAEEQIRDDREIRVDLPDTRLYPGQQVVELAGVELACGPTVDLAVTGPERIAITGRNGVGKTTLLQRIMAESPAVPWRLLPQRLDIFDEDRSVAANVRAAAPGRSDEEIRARLARFLFRGTAADVPAGALSGGERLRAALAVLLLADPAPRLLLLDEPTNNLDLPSLRHLTEALAEFQGALIVVSHDQRFLDEIGITRQLELTPDGLTEAPSAPC